MAWGLLKSKKPRFIRYYLENRDEEILVAFFQGDIWLTQKQLAMFYNLRIATVNEHLKKIFAKGGEGNEVEMMKQFEITAKDGKKYLTNHYRYDILEVLSRRVRR